MKDTKKRPLPRESGTKKSYQNHDTMPVGAVQVVCTQLGGDVECPKGLAPACCYEVCGADNLCGASCLVDDPKLCEWRREVPADES